MIKKLAIVLLSSFLMVGSMGQTVEAAHGVLWTYCPGNYVKMVESNVSSSWYYTHTEDFKGDRIKCYVHGRIDRERDYCFTCGKSQNIKEYQVEQHINAIFSYEI